MEKECDCDCDCNETNKYGDENVNGDSETSYNSKQTSYGAKESYSPASQSSSYGNTDPPSDESYTDEATYDEIGDNVEIVATEPATQVAPAAKQKKGCKKKSGSSKKMSFTEYTWKMRPGSRRIRRRVVIEL